MNIDFSTTGQFHVNFRQFHIDLGEQQIDIRQTTAGLDHLDWILDRLDSLFTFFAFSLLGDFCVELRRTAAATLT